MAISRRFGFPQNSTDPSSSLHLSGCYFSIGVIIRSLLDKIASENNVISSQTLSLLARIGTLIGIDLEVTRENKEIRYNKDNLEKLFKLAAPPSKELEFNGGRMVRLEYTNKDPTSGPEWFKYSQTPEEMQKQKESLIQKKEQNRKRKFGDPNEPGRFFFFPDNNSVLCGSEEEGPSRKIIRINYEDLKKSGFLKDKKHVSIIPSGNGYRIAFSGGSCHNTTATKKFWGTNSVTNDQVLKGNVLVLCTGNAPLDISEYMDPDPSWLNNYMSTSETVEPSPSKKEKTFTSIL